MTAAPRRVLVVCTRRIGDVLLVTPLVRSVKHTWPQASVDVMVFRGTESILAGNPDVAGVVLVGERDAIGERLRTMRATWRRYDIAFSAQTSDRTTLYAWAAGRRVFGLLDPARAPAWKRSLLDAWAPFDDLHTHTVVQGLALCDLAGVEKRFEVVPPASTESPTAIANAIGLDGVDEPFAVLHVSPQFPYKQWTAGGWREVGTALRSRGLRVVVSAGPDEAARRWSTDVAAAVPGAIDAAGRLSLPGIATLLRHARVYVGTDTAVTHLAAAAGTPTVALFGPSNPVKWGPWPVGCTTEPSPWAMRGTQRHGNVVLVQGEADCVPCRLEGCDRHVNSLSRCLQEMPATRVLEAVDSLQHLASPPGRMPK